MSAESISVREASLITGMHPQTIKRLCDEGRLPHFKTPGGHYRFRRSDLADFTSGRNRRPPAGNGSGPSSVLQNRRETVEELGLQTQELRARRDLRKLEDEEREAEKQRKAAAHALALTQEQERQRERIDAQREAEARKQKTAEAHALDRHRQWVACWLDYALKLLPIDVPHSFELEVHQVVADLLPKLDAQQPEQLTKRLVQAAIDKALQPWHKRKEIEKIIEEARNQLPVLVRSWSSTPNEWEARAMRAAADAIAQLGEDPPLASIRAAAVEAGDKVRAEYEAWKAGEDHRRACEQMAQWVFDGDDAREAVRQALGKLPVGTIRAKMENARDAALAPFRAATKAAADADRYLQHVTNHIEELGNEDTGEWDLGDWSERYDLAAKLRAKLRPVLIQKLLEEPLDVDEAHEFIEGWIDRNL